ncbi:GntR family transcriptional regulator [Mesorhizobium sp. 113-3-3]|uniref:GntR family transcriptional regulator n=1 Tax=Mesorhizobium sp. 113-3-3 TaxID=2744516 RepID=UPI001FD45DC8|nr:GntR family transcriptional regulator [Mesorhizobium sp. 113-3-3]
MSELEENAAPGERAYVTLKKMIIEGRLRPGQSAQEDDLAAYIDVDSPLLEAAVTRLVADGLVCQGAGNSRRVAALDRKYIDDVYQVCKALEVQTAVQAIDHIPTAAIEEFSAALEGIRGDVEAGKPYPVRDAYEHLQRMFIKYCENDLICSVLARLQDHLARVRFASRTMDDREWLHIEYWVMKDELDALRARDASRLATTLSAHMDMFRRWILQSWASSYTTQDSKAPQGGASAG